VTVGGRWQTGGVTYREQRPPQHLAGVVDAVWTRGPGVPGTKRVVPDGCMDVIWTGEDLIVAGPDTVAHVAEVGGSVPMLGLRFRPGAGPGYLGVPADAVRDVRAPLREFWAGDRVDQLIYSEDIRQALLDSVGFVPDRTAAQVARLARASGDVADMADELGLSERQLHRRSLAAFGYGPKVLHRVLRFGQALDMAYAGVAFADVAHRSGYADQAHLSREVKSLTGVSLRTLLSGG
jgi:AraC-like DNA-binding protein